MGTTKHIQTPKWLGLSRVDPVVAIIVQYSRWIPVHFAVVRFSESLSFADFSQTPMTSVTGTDAEHV